MAIIYVLAAIYVLYRVTLHIMDKLNGTAERTTAPVRPSERAAYKSSAYRTPQRKR
jgi:hypothetical protein